MGAYLSTFASCIPTILYATLLAGQYTTPLIYCEVTAAFTNTAPVDDYRGAGRTEATNVIVRIVHQAGVEMGIAQDEIRRSNYVREFRYQTPVGPVRFDLGYQLNPLPTLLVNGQPQHRRWRIHFSIGQAF